MRFSEAAEKMALSQPESEAKKQDPGPEPYTSRAIRIPLRIDDAIVVRSLTNMAHMARSKIIGAVHDKFILITEPTVSINERISAVLDEAFLCSYFSDGTLYTFRSRYRKHLVDDIVCIEYPREAEVRQVRRHRRIKVNIETECAVYGTADLFVGEMADISLGGSRLVFDQRVPMTKGTELTLTFNLPNEAFVSGLRAVVVRTDRLKNSKTTDVGLTFTGPQSEISKIANFCEFCMFFDLE